MRRFIFFAVLALSFLIPSLSASGAEPSQLIKAVILCRHGLRSPTQTPEELAEWSTRPWPKWNIAPGELTKRGASLLNDEGKLLQKLLAGHGLLTEERLAAPGSLFIYADKGSRTRASAEALLEGLAPDSDTEIIVSSGKGPDPLFHPVRSGLMASPDFSVEERSRLTAELENIRSRDARELSFLSSLLGPVVENSDVLHFPKEDSRKKLTLNGGLHTAASAAEILLLQCLEWPIQSQILAEETVLHTAKEPSPVEKKTLQILNAPAPDNTPSLTDAPLQDSERPVMVNPRTALELLTVHTDVQNTLQRAPAQALASGLPLLAVMTGILSETSPLDEANKAALSLFVGHDTNIANVAGLLGLHWQNGEFPPDSAPPGSILFFGLWETPQGKVVRAAYVRQSLAALLTTDENVMEEASLFRVPLSLPGGDGNGETSLENFTRHVIGLTSEPKALTETKN